MAEEEISKPSKNGDGGEISIAEEEISMRDGVISIASDGGQGNTTIAGLKNEKKRKRKAIAGLKKEKKKGEEYARVLRVFSGGSCEVMCPDYTKFICYTELKMLKIPITVGDIVLLAIKHNTAHLIHKYTHDDSLELKSKGALGCISIHVETDAEDHRDYIRFVPFDE
ncbi:hypothetical protein AMTR_s00002p00270720 [Amborella trichopoda]|uniref:Uncharacterized protein n=1 Tax=Amborella trichopoda TaxID=13333 RepID=W1P3I1_AMBTC|nr:hypothetical protein AMTR_s00002p00270720 [Amborella trichopoda]